MAIGTPMKAPAIPRTKVQKNTANSTWNGELESPRGAKPVFVTHQCCGAVPGAPTSGSLTRNQVT
jgi:hypothetical protein